MSKEGNRQSLLSENFESLRLILERQQQRPITYDEASEIGESLLSFYELLADKFETPQEG